MNKIKNYFILFLIVCTFGVFVYYNAKVSHLQKVIDAKAPPDTIKIEIVQHDTTVVKKADTVNVEYEIRGDTVFVNKQMTGFLVQPLFDLRVDVNSKNESFRFDIKYKILKLYFEIKDKYDIRKGFNLRTEPNLGIKYSVDWNNYTPLRKEKNFKLNLGIGYSKELGPFLLPGIQYKKNILGVFLKENSWGLYYQHSFGIF